MSIYSIEATPAEMAREAVERMKLLNLDEDAITAFESEGEVYLSERAMGGVFFCFGGEELTRRIKAFEEEYQCLVYHAHRSDTAMAGEVWSLLFVSPASSDWAGERQYLTDCGLVYAYVDSEMESGICEIQVEPAGGGIDRIG